MVSKTAKRRSKARTLMVEPIKQEMEYLNRQVARAGRTVTQRPSIQIGESDGNPVRQNLKQKNKAMKRSLSNVHPVAGQASLSNNMRKVEAKMVKGLGSSKPGNEMAKAVILPHNFNARYAAGWANTPTSVASPYVITTVDFSRAPASVPTYPAELAAGTFFAGVSRDPLCAILEYVPNPDNLPMSYIAKFTTVRPFSQDVTLTPVVTDRLILPQALGVQHPLLIDHWLDDQIGESTHLHPHGARMYARVCNQDPIHKFSFMQRGQKVTFVFKDTAGALVSLTGGLGLMRCNGDTITEATAIPFAAANSVTMSAQETGYWGFYLQWENVLSLPDLSLVVFGELHHDAGPTSVGSVIGHRPIPGIEDRTLLSGIRVNGVSIMITPDSVELAKGGRVTGAQLDTSFVVESIVKNANGGPPNNLIDNIPGSVGVDYHKGAYAFHKPRTEASFEKVTPFKHNVDYVPRALYGVTSSALTVCSTRSNINVPDGWLVYGVTTPSSVIGGVDTTYPGGYAHVTYSFSVEYWHYDIWIGTKLPPLGASQFNNVMQLLSTCQQFHENKMHIADLKKWYNGAMPTLKMFGPGIKAVLLRIAPELAPLIMAASAAASAMPDSI